MPCWVHYDRKADLSNNFLQKILFSFLGHSLSDQSLKPLSVQIHNPAKQNIALVYKDKKFNPESDIVSVIKNNDDIENSEYI